MDESFEGAVSFALSALRKPELVLTRHQKEALKSVISLKDTFVSFFAFKVVVGLLHPYDGVVARLAKAWSFTVPQFCSTVEFREP